MVRRYRYSDNFIDVFSVGRQEAGQTYDDEKERSACKCGPTVPTVRHPDDDDGNGVLECSACGQVMTVKRNPTMFKDLFG